MVENSEKNMEIPQNVVSLEENTNFPLKNQEEEVNLQKTNTENQNSKQNNP